MDTNEPSIDQYTKMIPPDMVLTYASGDDRNRKIESDSDYEAEDNDDDVLGGGNNSGLHLYLLQLSGR